MKKIKYSLCALMIVLVSIGASFTLKAQIGIGAWDALAQTGSYVHGLKVGTVGMILNIICVFLQFILLREAFKISHLLQIVMSVFVGVGINFFFYEVFATMVVDTYVKQMLLLLLGYVLNAFVVSVLMLIDVVTFSLEGACDAIANKLNVQFHHVRQVAEILSIVMAILLTYLFNVPLAVREGTIIGMLIFSPTIGFFMKKMTPIFRKYELTSK